MKESWRGPSVILGILGLLLTVAIFWHQIEEQKKVKEEQKRERAENERIEKELQERQREIAEREEQKRLDGIEISTRVKWIQRALPLYEDSLSQTKLRFRKSTMRESTLKLLLRDTLKYPPFKERYREAFNEFVIELRDSARLERIIYKLRKEERELSDSVLLYYGIDLKSN